MDILKALPGVQENILLSQYTTFRIGGPARYFFVAKNKEEIIQALKAAKEFEMPFYVLGGGSNLLVSDKGFHGLVIKILNTQYIIHDTKHDTKIIADAGVSFSKLIIEAIDNSLTGLEWGMGIPGTIGGAVHGNAGAHGHSISETVDKVITISPSDYSIKEYSREECGFVYRSSNFSNNGEVILQVEMALKKGDKEKSLEQIKDIISQRRTKVPPYPSPGSFFKNYRLGSKNHEEDPLIQKFPDLTKKIRSGKIGVAHLIDQCGLKGKQVGGAKVAEEHANFIVNAGGATAKDVLDLVDLIKKEVEEKWGIELEEETRFLGF